MESTLSAQEPGLIEALDFRLPRVANYVTSRGEVVFVPSGHVFAPSGVRTLRIPISGGAFVDDSSITVEATLTNLDGTNLLTPTTCSLDGRIKNFYVRGRSRAHWWRGDVLREALRTTKQGEGERGSRERSLPGAGLPSQHIGHTRPFVGAWDARPKPKH